MLRNERLSALFIAGTLLLVFLFRKNKNPMIEGFKIYGLLKLYGLPDDIARLATMQAAHETAGFQSAIYHENNNAFGYKFVGQKLATGENRGHATYKTVSDSVKEFVGWWNRRRLEDPFPMQFNIGSFANYLKKHRYYEDSPVNYSRGMEHWQRQIFG